MMNLASLGAAITEPVVPASPPVGRGRVEPGDTSAFARMLARGDGASAEAPTTGQDDDLPDDSTEQADIDPLSDPAAAIAPIDPTVAAIPNETLAAAMNEGVGAVLALLATVPPAPSAPLPISTDAPLSGPSMRTGPTAAVSTIASKPAYMPVAAKPVMAMDTTARASDEAAALGGQADAPPPRSTSSAEVPVAATEPPPRHDVSAMLNAIQSAFGPAPTAPVISSSAPVSASAPLPAPASASLATPPSPAAATAVPVATSATPAAAATISVTHRSVTVPTAPAVYPAPAEAQIRSTPVPTPMPVSSDGTEVAIATVAPTPPQDTVPPATDQLPPAASPAPTEANPVAQAVVVEATTLNAPADTETGVKSSAASAVPTALSERPAPARDTVAPDITETSPAPSPPTATTPARPTTMTSGSADVAPPAVPTATPTAIDPAPRDIAPAAAPEDDSLVAAAQARSHSAAPAISAERKPVIEGMASAKADTPRRREEDQSLPVADRAPSDPGTPAPLAAATVSGIDASAATGAAQPSHSQQSIARHLDLARDSQWLDQLAQDISQAATREGHLKFNLNPEHLGSLQVEIVNTAAGTSVRMTADTDAARTIIADAQPRLVAEARAQGLRITETHVDLGGQAGSGSTNGRQPSSEDHKPFVRTQVVTRDGTGDSPQRADDERYA